VLDHLGPVDTTARAAVLTGDPDRVPRLASAVGPVRRTWTRRGFVCVEVGDGTTEPILVCSTGIGGPATAIAVEELIRLGVRTFARVGTCGSLQPAVRPGHVVVSSGSVRDEGTSHQYLPASYPAVPTVRVLGRIIAEVERAGLRHHVGITHCKDAYYAEKPADFPHSTEWEVRWATLRATGVLATEMEAAALFTVAQVRGVEAAALFVPVDDTVTAEDTFATLAIAAAAARDAMR
jgi:uridine phosphorylase